MSKKPISELVKDIKQYIGIDITKSTRAIEDKLMKAVKQFQVKVNSLCDEYTNSGDVKPEIERLLNSFANEFDSDDAFWDFIYGDFYKYHVLPYTSNWRVFIMIIQRIIDVLEKTDSWLSSKNV